MFVVVGATGHTGSVVADTLLSREQPVRIASEEPDHSPPLLLYGELGAGDWHGGGSRHLADVHCASSYGPNDRDQRYRSCGRGAIDGRWNGQTDSGTRRAGRI